jgi:hypothetical protein
MRSSLAFDTILRVPLFILCLELGTQEGLLNKLSAQSTHNHTFPELVSGIMVCIIRAFQNYDQLVSGVTVSQETVC